MIGLNQLLRDQRKELESGIGKSLIRRNAEKYFSNLLQSKLIKVVSGVRRSGKSVFIYLLLKNKTFAYVNFDDDRLIGAETNEILSSFYEVYGKDFKYIFIDEVQNLENWELFVNRLHRAGFNVFVTGSNAKLLSRELATHLTGRHISIEIFPFSFSEFLNAADFNEDIRTTKGNALVKMEFERYLDTGGFPEIVVNKEPPLPYLRSLYTSVVEGDIIGRHNITHKKTFKEISQTLMSNPCRSVSFNKLKNQFNLGSEHTAKNYLSFIEESYLLFSVGRFSHKPFEIEKSDKKVYAIDTGMVKALSTKTTKDLGQEYENCVALELLRRKSFDGNLSFYYWKNVHHEEVDFVVREGPSIKQLIQVCYSVENKETKEREIKSLIKAGKDLKCHNLLIITNDKEGREKIANAEIQYIPLWKWLLD